MVTEDAKQFSFKKKVPSRVLSEFGILKKTFRTHIETLFGNNAEVSLRKFFRTSSCRFTVKFEKWQKNTTEVENLVEKAIADTIEELTINKHKLEC